MDEETIIEATRRWISSLVIGLGLCPFAQRVFNAGAIRYVHSQATDPVSLLEDLTRELEFLAASPIASVETTLLIHAQVLADFLDYNDFLDPAEQLIESLGLQGVIQLASFHPNYQFAGTAPDAVENYTNRSPYPMLHLLREESISNVASDPTVLEEIPRRNIETLRGLGKEWVLEKLKEIERR